MWDFLKKIETGNFGLNTENLLKSLAVFRVEIEKASDKITAEAKGNAGKNGIGGNLIFL